MEQQSQNNSNLALVALINFFGFLFEFTGGVLFGSIALISDGIHMLFDSLAYVFAWGAEHLATNQNSNSFEQYSYELHRLEPFSAFLNGILLFPMVAFILIESYHRFQNPIEINTTLVLGFAIIGLIFNIISVYFIEGKELSLNEKGAYYHLLGDAGASIMVIISTVIIEITNMTIIDPITAIFISTLIVGSALSLVKGSAGIFFHKSPIPENEIREQVNQIDSVESVLDCHIWNICSQITIATLHVQINSTSAEENEMIREKIHFTLNKLGVDHATVEILPRNYGMRKVSHNH